MAAEGTGTLLPQTIASHIEELRQERLRAYADRAFRVNSGIQSQTELERSVDDLLDSLTTLHQLDQLASCVAHGGQVTVDADQLLIAENEETYLKLLAQYKSRRTSRSLVPASFLPSHPLPLD
jgi:hypothetical protein